MVAGIFKVALLKTLFGETVEPMAQRSPDITTHLAQVNLRLKRGAAETAPEFAAIV